MFYESSSESEDEQTTETSEKVEAPAPSGLPAGLCCCSVYMNLSYYMYCVIIVCKRDYCTLDNMSPVYTYQSGLN